VRLASSPGSLDAANLFSKKGSLALPSRVPLFVVLLSSFMFIIS
jgi:hypothetical protein